MLKGNADEMYPDYLGCCRSLDDNLARVIDKLKQKGIYENTIIIFASDHGSHFMTRNLDANLNGYDDYKRSCHSSACHVPLVIAGGKYVGGKRVKELVSTASLPKTFLAMAGIDVGDKMIGEDLYDVVSHKNPQRLNQVFTQISESRIGRALRTEKYLYAVTAPNKNGGEQAGSDIYVEDFLYDLEKDPFELNNLVTDPAYEQVRVKLRQQLADQMVMAKETRPQIFPAGSQV